MRLTHIFTALLLAQLTAHAAESEPRVAMQEKHRALFKEHCISCHGPEKQKGKFRVDDLPFSITNVETAEKWQKVLNSLNSGEMPPEDEKQPEGPVKADFLDDLANVMVAARRSLGDQNGVITMRRLNRREYRNTLRELLGVEIDVSELPPDTSSGGFDTVGANLFMSGNQFEQYQSLGREALTESFERQAAAAVEKSKRYEAEAWTPMVTKYVAYQIDARERAQKWVKAMEEAVARPENKDIVAKLKLETKAGDSNLRREWAKIPGAPNPRTFGFDKKGENDADLANDSLGAGWLPYHQYYLQQPALDTGAYLGTQTRHPAELNVNYIEFLVPFDWPVDKEDMALWPVEAKAPFDAFHTARQTMQRRMDASIQAHAEQETLYDKPRIDRNRLRITGPFSVEAVPAPTVLSLDDSLPPAEANDSIARTGETSRQSLWRDELLKTGVRAKGGARLTFAEFETLPGLRHLHASGSLTDTGERVVVSFGPEHAALEQRQVELALTEAETLRPAPKFILFCAFTFDPEAAKDIDEVNWPGVTLLKAQMNTDLLTEDLKKARSSNQSFWLMGQPDVELRKRKDGMWEVEVNGFDYFDPRAGDLVSGGKKQIAMWSLDTDYDQRSLMPHQVFFPMADAKGGWNRLKATVRSELDEDLLEQFHGTVSLPFEAGDNRRIAVKIVDDRGIESLKIMPLGD